VAASFANKRVLITGGSSGIGRALACALAREGAHVCIVARGQARIDEAVSELRTLAVSREQVLFGLALDIGEPAQIDAAVAPVLAQLGGLDVLINNAGITYPAAFVDTPRDVVEQIMRINFSGTVDVTRAFLPTMVASGGGQIAIVSSLAGLLGIYGFSAYAASKFALRGFAECLRQELLVHRIAITLVFPPDTDTPMLQKENQIKPAETAAIAGTVKPLTAEFVAAATLAGLRRRHFDVIPGLSSKLVAFMARRLPALTRWILDAQLRGFQRRRRRAA
jgi:3-dehydrosphinganine reductase